ncbi:MAG: hypothetical protein R2729_28525 [Bryobacteraceae bacterium]
MSADPRELLRRVQDIDDSGDVGSAIQVLADGISSGVCSENVLWLSALTIHMSILCEQTGRLDLAIEFVKKALPEIPNDLGLLYTLANLLGLKGETEEARIVAERFRRACDVSTDEDAKRWSELIPSLDRMLS